VKRKKKKKSDSKKSERMGNPKRERGFVRARHSPPNGV